MINKTNWNWVTKIAFFFFPDAFDYDKKLNYKIIEYDDENLNFIQKITFFFFPDAYRKK
jgi:hypothetical protein